MKTNVCGRCARWVDVSAPDAPIDIAQGRPGECFLNPPAAALFQHASNMPPVPVSFRPPCKSITPACGHFVPYLPQR
jgi:hypothetical protein